MKVVVLPSARNDLEDGFGFYTRQRRIAADAASKDDHHKREQRQKIFSRCFFAVIICAGSTLSQLFSFASLR